jgi:N12 class adenine-specific DNA methylase
VRALEDYAARYGHPNAPAGGGISNAVRYVIEGHVPSSTRTEWDWAYDYLREHPELLTRRAKTDTELNEEVAEARATARELAAEAHQLYKAGDFVDSLAMLDLAADLDPANEAHWSKLRSLVRAARDEPSPDRSAQDSPAPAPAPVRSEPRTQPAALAVAEAGPARVTELAACDMPDGCGAAAGEPCLPGCPSRATDEGDERVERAAHQVAVPSPSSFRPTTQAELAPSGSVARVRANLDALAALRDLGVEARPATATEQAQLARWSGWGAVPEVFDDGHPEFEWARTQLAELLTPAELAAAARNTLNAHYTDLGLVQPIWNSLAELGFTGGRVLEPGCGSGNFIGSAPAGARMVGVELDPVTARIAAALYPDAQILAESFADTDAPTGSFDLTVGNVPFAKVALVDRVHNGAGHTIHNHFILKSLALTKPGGLVALITSRYTLDSASPAARREMAQLADLVGAIRLPPAAHQRAAGTKVVTDLLVLRRRDPDAAPAEDTETWERAELAEIEGQQVRVNAWFLAHPEMVCGELAVGSGQFSAAELTVRADRPAPELLNEKLGLLVEDARARRLTHSPVTTSVAAPRAALVGRAAGLSNHHVQMDNNQFVQVNNGELVEFPVPATQRPELRALLRLRDDVVGLLEAEAASLDTTETITRLRASLNTNYDSYLARYGPINRYRATSTGRIHPESGEPIMARRAPAQGGFRLDPHSPLVYALEQFDDATQQATKAAIFTERVVAPRPQRLGADSPADALAICMDDHGRIDLQVIARLLGLAEPTQAREALGELVFSDPAHQDGQLVTAAEYLSGNVRIKLRAAQEAALEQPELRANVNALAAVVPTDIAPENIVARLGASWIGEADIQAFLREILDDRYLTVEHAYGSRWAVEGRETGVAATTTWGTEDLSAPEIAQALLQQQPITVHDEVEMTSPDGSTYTRKVLNVTKTTAAQAKADELSDRFSDWVWDDPERALRLAATYNELFNSVVLRSYDEAKLSLPGLALTFQPRQHQIAAVARMIAEPSAGLWHEVGAGKTAEMIIGVMELGRLGLVDKPAIVVPNHLLAQFSRDFLQLYPRARVLAASTADLTRDKRRAFVARIATGRWDAVIMTQGAFQKLPMSPEAQKSYLDQQLDVLREAIERQKAKEGRSITLKRMEGSLYAAEERMKAKLDTEHDPAVTWEHSGIGYVVVDEADMYKNLRTPSNIPGAAIDGSERASDLEMKLHHLREHSRSGRVATFATATPIANSLTEAHVMMRFLRPDLLEAAGVSDFDTWAATFARTITEVEMSPDGARFRLKSRVARFHNVPELLRMWWVAGDVKTADDLNLPRPELRPRHPDGQRAPEVVTVPSSELLREFIADLGERADRVRDRLVDPEIDNMLKISHDGRSAALDMRLVGQPMSPGESKIEVVAERVARIWAERRDDRFTAPDGQPHPTPGSLQLVFCDLSTPRSDRWNVYDELAEQLVTRGMPRASIRFIHEAANDKQKDQLFQACRAGQVSVLIGSTSRMGAGTNVQQRVVALHHMDCPWRPRDITQREGRALRQGNQYAEIELYRYVVSGSFDAYMWQTLARKAAFIGQVMRGNLDVREIDDVGDATLSYKEVRALAAGNPLLMDKTAADADLTKYERLERSYGQSRDRLHHTIATSQRSIPSLQTEIATLDAAIAARLDTRGDKFVMTVEGRDYDNRADGTEALRHRLLSAINHRSAATLEHVVSLAGLPLTAHLSRQRDVLRERYEITYRFVLDGLGYPDVVGSGADLAPDSSVSLAIRLENLITGLDRHLTRSQNELSERHHDITKATAELERPFAYSSELAAARERVADIEAQLAELAQEPTNDAEATPPAEETPAPTSDQQARAAQSATSRQPVVAQATPSPISPVVTPPGLPRDSAVMARRSVGRASGRPS